MRAGDEGALFAQRMGIGANRESSWEADAQTLRTTVT